MFELVMNLRSCMTNSLHFLVCLFLSVDMEPLLISSTAQVMNVHSPNCCIFLTRDRSSLVVIIVFISLATL